LIIKISFIRLHELRTNLHERWQSILHCREYGVNLFERFAMRELIFPIESYKIIGACIEVHKKLGAGFLESVYSEALEIEFRKNGIPYSKEEKLQIFYDDARLMKYFRADFVCFNSIIVELKSNAFINVSDKRQAVNYLKATRFRLALLINFGSTSLVFQRIVN
jgi:GxxExxY protein